MTIVMLVAVVMMAMMLGVKLMVVGVWLTFLVPDPVPQCRVLPPGGHMGLAQTISTFLGTLGLER